VTGAFREIDELLDYIDTYDSLLTAFLAAEYDWMSSLVTASSPLVIYHDGWQAVAAVVGLKMKYSTLYEHFANATTSCGHTPSGDNCSVTCHSPVSGTMFIYCSRLRLSLFLLLLLLVCVS